MWEYFFFLAAQQNITLKFSLWVYSLYLIALLQFNYRASFLQTTHTLNISDKCNHSESQEAPCWLLTLSTCDNSLEKGIYSGKLCKVSDSRHWPTSNFKLSCFNFSYSSNIIGYYRYFHFHPYYVHDQVFFPKLTLFLRNSEKIAHHSRQKLLLHKIYTNIKIMDCRCVLMNHWAIRSHTAPYHSCLPSLLIEIII